MRLTNRDFAVQVVKQLVEAGFTAYWAGGCVRDQLLGRQPKDYDVATNATPEQVRSLFGYRRTLPIGVSFGVITVLGPKPIAPIEVATFRSDGEYSDGRHPDAVSFCDAQEDAQRRDFTINGLFFDPLQQRVIDFVGGQDDLRDGVIRAIGDPAARFHEDKLRMLRAVRFAATFQFRLDEATALAIQRDAENLSQVSAERVAAEMRRMMVHRNRALALRLLLETDLFSSVFGRKIAGLRKLAGQTVWNQALEACSRLDVESFPTAMACLLVLLLGNPSSPEPTLDAKMISQHLASRWKLANAERDEMEWLMSTWPTIRAARQAPWPVMQRILIRPEINHLMALCTALSGAMPELTAQIQWCEEKLHLPVEQLDPEPLVTGDDLLAAGIPTGPHYRMILQEIRDAQLEGRIQEKSNGISLALAWYRNAGVGSGD